MTNHDADLDAIVAMLEEADLVEQSANEEGKSVLRPTERGEAIGRALAMGEEADVEVVLDALLDASEGDT